MPSVTAAGLHVDLHTTVPGVVELPAAIDHRLKIHAGPPVRGSCRLGPFLYSSGDVDLVPAGVSDMWHAHDPTTAVIVRLAPSLLRDAAEEMGLEADRASLAPRHQFRDPQIEYIARALDAERRAGFPNGRLYLDSLGTGLAVHLVGGYAAQARQPRGLSKPQLRRIVEFVDAHLDDDLSLERLARIAGISASHLKTMFRRSTGVPVHAYVVRQRVERAKALLQRGDMPVGQVALEVGFSHQSHLARWMRRLLGVTPSSLLRGARS